MHEKQNNQQKMAKTQQKLKNLLIGINYGEPSNHYQNNLKNIRNW